MNDRNDLQSGEALCDFIQLKNKPPVAGLQWFESLLTAIKNQQVIEIDHQSFDKDHPSKHILSR